jgi:hypothetical protein
MCNTSVHIQCEVMYDSTDVRRVSFVLSKFRCLGVYKFIFFGQKYDDPVSVVI